MLKYIVFFSLLSFASCRSYPYLYVPNELNMPLPGHKADFKANASWGTSGYGLSASYAIDSNLLICGDGALLNGPLVFKEINNVFVSDIGGGYYRKAGRYWRFDFTGGVGYGNANSHAQNIIFSRKGVSDSTENLRVRADFVRGSLQADAGFVIDNVNVGFGLRLCDHFYTGNITATYTDTNQVTGRKILLPLNGSALFLEQGFMLGLGLRNVKLYYQMGLSLQLSGMTGNPYYGPLYFPFYFDLGLSLQLFHDR